jgi:hypothetical protein
VDLDRLLYRSEIACRVPLILDRTVRISKVRKNRSNALLLNKEEANMLNTKSLFALALLVPLLGATIREANAAGQLPDF